MSSHPIAPGWKAGLHVALFALLLAVMKYLTKEHSTGKLGSGENDENLLFLLGDPGLIPSIHIADQLSLAPVLGHLIPYSGFLGYQAYAEWIFIHAEIIFIHLKCIFNFAFFFLLFETGLTVYS